MGGGAYLEDKIIVFQLIFGSFSFYQKTSKLTGGLGVGEERGCWRRKVSLVFPLCFSISWVVVEDVNWFVSGFDTFHNIVSASLSAGLDGAGCRMVCQRF